MTGRRSTTRLALIALVGLLALPVLAVAQDDGPRTDWGAPDLQGVWDFRTITPLQRPEDLGDKAFLTEEEAAERERNAVERDIELWDAEARRTEPGGNVGGYNNFWMDRGTRVVGTRRTSLVIDPPNGRLPEMTDAGRARQAAGRGSFSDQIQASYTDFSNADRCLMGFNAGPPITPGGYNQNVQIFQTPDHVVLMTEMVHTVRAVPLDGRPRWTRASRNGPAIRAGTGRATPWWSRPPTSTSIATGGEPAPACGSMSGSRGSTRTPSSTSTR